MKALGAVVLFFPTLAWANPIIDSGDGFAFDFYAGTGESGYMSNGSVDAYDGCYALVVNGVGFAAEGPYTDAFAGRGFYSDYDHIGSFEIQRSAYVPAAGGNWARYIDTFLNTGIAVEDLTVSYTCNLGSDGGTNVVATYDGDTTIEAVDDWAVTDDWDGGADPALAHVIAGPGGMVGPGDFTSAVDNMPFSYPVLHVNPGDTVAIMFYAVQETFEADAQAAAESLVDLGGIALEDVGPEYDFVVNFPSGGAGATCGNGIVEGRETCDDGNRDSSDACMAWCRDAVCGDGIVWVGVEACDDADADDTDACPSTCEAARCGDGFVEAGVEACDDGNLDGTDACTALCENAACGDGSLRAGVEACDDGNLVDTDACTAACEDAVCGDGIVRAGVEPCDDGNARDTDACTTSCSIAACGDGFVRAGFEACDDGNDVDTDACRADCTLAFCGDGVVEAGVEDCDDGNSREDDACRASCLAAVCGDGILESGVEACDDGNVVAGDGCDPVCVAERGYACDGRSPSSCATVCGDGIVTGLETCDDGNAQDGDGCSSDCVPDGGGDADTDSDADADVDADSDTDVASDAGPDGGAGCDEDAGCPGTGHHDGGGCGCNAPAGPPSAGIGILPLLWLVRRRERHTPRT